MSDQSDQICIVTGASRGIGAATARLAAQRGYAVVVNFKSNESAAQAVVGSIMAAGGRGIAIKADIGDPIQIKRLFKETCDQLGTPTALVNNAAEFGKRRPIAGLNADEVSRILAVGLTGPILCISEVARLMSTESGGKGGVIVNVSSQAANTGGRQLTAYVGAKGGLNAITAGLARELGPLGIRINTVSPGIIDTAQQPVQDKNSMSETIRTIPLRRLGTAADVAEAICWLLSPAAAYITGAVIPITGGR